MLPTALLLVAVTQAAPYAPADRAPSARSSSARSSSDSCAITLDAQHRLHFPDGRAAHVGVKSLAARGDTLAVLGDPVVIGRPGATGRRRVAPVRGVLGFVVPLDTGARPIPIPNPLRGGRTRFPRVASADAGGWHVVFAQHPDTSFDQEQQPTTKLTLWYGRFDGRRWRELQRIAAIREANVMTERGSVLLARGERLAFAFAVGGDGQAHGVVVAARRSGRWRVDTLPSEQPPRYVRLLPALDTAAWDVVLTRREISRARLSAGSIAVVRFDTAFGAPHVLARRFERSYDYPQALVQNGELLVTWLTRHDAAPGRVSWAAWDRSTLEPRGAGPIPGDADDLLAFVTASDQAVWLLRRHDSTATEQLRVAVRRDAEPNMGRPLRLRNDTWPQVLPLDDGRIALTHSRVSHTGSEPAVLTLVSVGRLACPTPPARRESPTHGSPPSNR